MPTGAVVIGKYHVGLTFQGDNFYWVIQHIDGTIMFQGVADNEEDALDDVKRALVTGMGIDVRGFLRAKR